MGDHAIQLHFYDKQHPPLKLKSVRDHGWAFPSIQAWSRDRIRSMMLRGVLY